MLNNPLFRCTTNILTLGKNISSDRYSAKFSVSSSQRFVTKFYNMSCTKGLRSVILPLHINKIEIILCIISPFLFTGEVTRLYLKIDL